MKNRKIVYRPNGICARMITIDVNENSEIDNVEFSGGCDGNHKGIAALCKGRKVEEVERLLQGIRCGKRSTSCPDQLAQALKGVGTKI